MRPGGGKKKGSAFEREVCAALSKWVTDGKRNDILWRSSMSGGRATVHGKMAHVAGDICAVHPDGARFIAAFYIECKHYRDMQLTQMLTRSTGRLAIYWGIASANARECKKAAMLVFRQNQYPTMVCLSAWSVAVLRVGPGLTGIIPPLDCHIIPLDILGKSTCPSVFSAYRYVTRR